MERVNFGCNLGVTSVIVGLCLSTLGVIPSWLSLVGICIYYIYGTFIKFREARKRKGYRNISRKSQVGPTKIVEDLVVLHEWDGSNKNDHSKLSRILSKGDLSKCLKVDRFYTPNASKLLESVSTYNFPIFDLASACNNLPLMAMFYCLSVPTGLIVRVGVCEKKILNYVRAVQLGYRKRVSFHNSTHAADVLHCVNYFLQSPKLIGVFTNLEILSMYLAAAVHDLDHPGLDNDFLTAAKHSTALKYNDNSVLENHHCFLAFSLLKFPTCDFTESLKSKDYVIMRRIITETVLATDPCSRVQLALIEEFKSRLNAEGSAEFDPKGNYSDKLVLAKAIIRLADVSNTTKSWVNHREWTKLLCIEQRLQMQLEEMTSCRSPEYSAKQKLSASLQASKQKLFVEGLVYPLATLLCKYLELNEVLRGIEKNIWGLDVLNRSQEFLLEKEHMDTCDMGPLLEEDIEEIFKRNQEKGLEPRLYFKGFPPKYEESSCSDILNDCDESTTISPVSSVSCAKTSPNESMYQEDGDIPQNFGPEDISPTDCGTHSSLNLDPIEEFR